MTQAANDHRHGHRDRLRARLLKAGREAFEDYELLELLLSYAIPRIDVKPLAKRLIERFGSFAAVFDQPRERLLEVDGVGAQAATLVVALRAAMTRYLEQGVERAVTIRSPEDVAEFVRTELGANPRECLLLLCLNDRNRLVRHATVIEGTVDRAPFYPRELLKLAFASNATALLLVHNHPSGDPTPSENDHAITRRLEALAAELGLTLHDHLIVTPRSAFSLKTGKLL
ncbi:MAG: DNA repair protein RadC [Deltaproteobacteria bacterium]|nr:DNA repair protein RadC [Deltaproteobacteria bacterium]